MNPTRDQQKFIRQCKGIADGVNPGLSFDIFTEFGEKIGAIRTIDTGLVNNSDIVSDMAKWRRQAAGYFLSEFEVTFERTKNWLRDVVLPSDNRIMFLVEDEYGRLIGQYGIANLSPLKMELDNGIRGETGGHSRLFYYIELSIINLGFSKLGVEQVQVGVFKDNFAARRLHRSVGFTNGVSHLLVKTRMPNGDLRYLPVGQIPPSPDIQTREHELLMITREEFYRKIPWMFDKEEK